MQMKHLCFLALLALTPAYGATSNPLGKVLELIDSLAAKLTKEGEAEDKAFKEYIQWCEDTTRNTGFEIKTLTSQAGKLKAQIDKLTSDIDDGAARIDELATQISKADADLKAATALRNEEHADFLAAEKELVESIDMLDRAITILSREMAKNPAALMQVDTSSVSTLLKSLSVVIDAAGFSSSDRSGLMALVQSHSSDEEEVAGAPDPAAYKSHSSGIVDVLDNMKEKAEGELSDARKAETNSQHNFDMKEQSLEDEIEAATKDKDETAAEKAANEEALATAQGDLETTVAALKKAKADLATAQRNCMQVATDHSASVAGRAAELKAISTAKKILQDSTGGAVEQTYSFAQINSRSQTANNHVLGLIKKLAEQQHSMALSQLASRIGAVIKMGGGDPFAKVKGLIQQMIARLEKEAKEEATEKAYCDEEMAKTEEKKSDLEGDIAKLTAKIDKAAARSAELKEEVKTLQQELAELAKTQAEMDKARQDANAVWVKANADLTQGLAGVKKALGVLRDYYANAEFVQQPAMPAYHKAAGGAGNGIIDILEVCESDFTKNLAQINQQEDDEQAEYEKTTQANAITKTTKEKDVEYKTKESTSLDKKIADLSSDRETANTELSAVLDYYGKLKDRCIAKPETYEERKARREAEIAGLKEALRVLEDETAFVQRGQRFLGA